MAAMVTDAGGVIEFANPPMEGLTGCAAGELTGRPIGSNLLGAKVQEEIQTVAASGQAWQGESVWRRSTGEENPVAVTISPVHESAAEARHVLVTARGLADSEQLFRSLATGTPDYILVQDKNLRYVWTVNPPLGLRVEDVLGRTDAEILPAEAAERITGMQRGVLESGQARKAGLALPCVRSGETQYYEGTYAPRRDSQGRIDGILGFFRDVTGQRRAEKTLEAIFAAMDEGVVFQNAEGVIETCNASAERILGLTADQMNGRASVDPRWAAIHEDGSPFPGETHPGMIALRTGQAVANVVMGVHKPDGRLMWISIHARPLMGEGGTPNGVVATFADVTERKRTEDDLAAAHAAVARAEAHFRLVFHASADGIVVHTLSSDGGWNTFSEVNDKALALLGRTRAELLGMRVPDIVAPEALDSTREFIRSLTASGAFVGESVLVTADGRRIPVEVSSRLVHLEGADTIVSCIRDISKRLEAEANCRNIFEGALEGIYRISTERKSLAANPAFATMLGYGSAEELVREVTDSALHLWVDQEDRRRLLAVLNEEGSARGFECQFKRKDGSAVWVSFSTRAVRDSEGRTLYYEGFVKDISERKNAQAAIETATAALASAERHFRLLFDSGSDAVFVFQLQPDGLSSRFTDVNAAAGSLLGYSRDELLQMRVGDIDAPDRHPTAAAVIRRLRDERKVLRESALVAKDGRRIPVEMSSQCIEAEGQTTVISAVRDISERLRAEAELKRANEALAAAGEHYRTLFDSGSDAIFLHRLGIDGMPGELVDVNNNACRYLGYTRDELRQLAITDIDAPEEHQEVRGRMRRLLAEGSLLWETIHAAKDGRRIPVEVHTRVVGTGEARLLLSHVRDISERIEAERRYQDIFEGAVEGIFTASIGGRLLRANPAYARILGYASANELLETVTDVARQLWLNPEERKAVLETMKLQGKLLGYETRARKKDGNGVWISFNARMVFGAEGQPLYTEGFILEITEQKRAEELAARLEERSRQAERLESVGRLAGGVAHEFNNLLTVINGFSSFLVDGLEPTDPLRGFAEAIRKSGNRAANLTQQLLAFGRKQMITPKAINLGATVKSFAATIERVLGEKRVLVTNLRDGSGEVLADADQLRQVLMNLVLNARDAMPDGGRLEITTENVEFNAENVAALDPEAVPGPYVRMTVTDTGHGMDEGTRQHVFEPFFTTKKVGEGTGLGLATVYGIVRQSGGWPLVSSAVGAGTSFSVYLPRLDMPSPAAAVERETGGVPVDSQKRETILLVDDEKSVRAFLKASLERHGYTVIDASDGRDAIAAVEQHPEEIRLLIADVVLPGMDGKSVSERLTALRPNLRTIYVSGYTADVFAERCLLDEGAGFLQKPFGSEDLAKLVRQVLDAPAKPVG